jgi:hypothetical protein
MSKDKLKHQLKYAIFGVIASWIVIPATIFFAYGFPENSGVLGDTFGIINALFSALAFALLIYSSMMQREELELQREELKLTREEIKKSADAQESLVRLTNEQFEFDKTVRKNQIKPELVLKDARPTQQTNKYLIQINFTVKYNRIKIFRYDIRGEKGDYQNNNDWAEMTFNKYYEPSQDVFIIIESPTQQQGYPNGLKIDIYFDDIDSRTYRQTVTFENNNILLSNTQDYSKSNFLLS